MNKHGGFFEVGIAFLVGTFFGAVILDWLWKLIKGWLGL